MDFSGLSKKMLMSAYFKTDLETQKVIYFRKFPQDMKSFI